MLKRFEILRLWERLNSSRKKILPSDEVFVSGMFQGFGIQPGQAYLTYHAAWQKDFSKQLKKIIIIVQLFLIYPLLNKIKDLSFNSNHTENQTNLNRF